MNQQEAEKALGIIREVIQNTREDLVAHNWGAMWIVHSFVNLAACLCGWYAESQGLSLLWYLAPLAAAAAVNLAVVMLLLTRDQGIRSYVEWQIHGIWVTFIIFTLAGAGVLHLTGASPKLFGPLFAMTTGIAFAMMGVVFNRQFPYAVLFLLAMFAEPITDPYLPGAQWGVIGVLWWCAQFIPGLEMYREKRRREQHGADARIL
jgi:hypothetical protein